MPAQYKVRKRLAGPSTHFFSTNVDLYPDDYRTPTFPLQRTRYLMYILVNGEHMAYESPMSALLSLCDALL